MLASIKTRHHRRIKTKSSMLYYYSYILADGTWQTIAAADSKREAMENVKFHAKGRGTMFSTEVLRAREFIDAYNARWGKKLSRASLSRWCASGVLPCQRVKNPASGTGVEYFILEAAVHIPPPKRGNPAIAKLRRKTLRKKL